MDFDPALLRAFVAVTETGGFTRAAERLHLTQSAISHQIRRLEQQVGRRLLCRTTHRLELTEEGNDFLRHAEAILRSLDALTARFRPSPLAGLVRFGVPESFMGDRLPPLLCQFARAFPAVRLDVSVTTYLDLRAMVDAGDLDLAVVLSTAGQPRERVLRRTQFVWVAAETFDPPPAGAPLPLAMAPAQCVNRQVGLTALADTAIDWRIVFTSPSHQGLRAAVLAGLGVTVLTRDSIEPGMKVMDGACGLPSLPAVAFSLAWSKEEPTPAAKAFARLIADMPKPARDASGALRPAVSRGAARRPSPGR